MPDEPSANDAQSQVATGDSPSTGAQPSSPTSSSVDDPRTIRSADAWRYPDDFDVPWLRGKTAKEAAEIGNKMFQSMVNGQPQQPVQPENNRSQYGYNQPQPQHQYTPPGMPQPPTQDDWLTDPQDATRRQIDYEAQTRFAPQFQQTSSAVGQMSLELVRQGDKDSFDRWGPEILSHLQTVDQQFWTVPNIKKIVGMVKADHLDEITSNLVERRIQQMSDNGTIIRPGSSPPGTSIGRSDGVDLDMDKLPARYREQLEKSRMTPEVLKEFLMKTEVEPRGISLKQAYEDWFKDATSGDVLLAGDE